MAERTPDGGEDLVRRNEFDGATLNFFHATPDLDTPSRLHVAVTRIKAGKQFLGQARSVFRRQSLRTG